MAGPARREPRAMSAGEDDRAPEILIIRRKSGGEDDCHHGGVWKIAYADFMTAMMAFFLVMWLINAANDSVKASVASYFNPMRFTDATARRKGLSEPAKENDAKAEDKSGASGERAAGKPGDDAKRGAVDNAVEKQRKLALTFDKAAPAVRREESAANAAAASLSGSAFRDPFNPQSPAQSTREPSAAEASVPRPSDKPDVRAAEPAQGTAEAPSTIRGAQPEPPGEAPQKAGGTDPKRAAEARRMSATAADVESRVKKAVNLLGINGGPGIDVTIEGDSVVLSLTDTSNFGMFAIGSSSAGGELTRLMQAIAPVVLANGERIIVRGHTDSRPFRGERGNNWRLSMERAEAAHGLLLRAGVDERRFERIEAHADQKPRNAADREAAVNRRIEILLRRTRN